MNDVEQFVEENRDGLRDLVEKGVANDWVIQAMLDAFPPGEGDE